MSHGKRGALARSKSIDQQIDEERQRRHNEIQLLILGKYQRAKIQLLSTNVPRCSTFITVKELVVRSKLQMASLDKFP